MILEAPLKEAFSPRCLLQAGSLFIEECIGMYRSRFSGFWGVESMSDAAHWAPILKRFASSASARLYLKRGVGHTGEVLSE